MVMLVVRERGEVKRDFGADEDAFMARRLDG